MHYRRIHSGLVLCSGLEQMNKKKQACVSFFSETRTHTNTDTTDVRTLTHTHTHTHHLFHTEGVAREIPGVRFRDPETTTRTTSEEVTRQVLK